MSNIGYLYAVPVPDVTSVLVDFDTVRIYRRASRTGSDTLISSQTLVAATTSYTYQDASAVSTSWFCHDFYNSSTLVQSAKTEPVPAGGALVVDALTLRRRVAHLLDCFGLPPGNYTFPGVSGTASSGSTSTAVCAAYINSRYPGYAFQDWFYCAVSGTASSSSPSETQIASLNNTTGTFTFARNLGAAVANTDTFDLFAQRPSSFWDECLWRADDGAYLNLWVPFQYPIAGQAAGSDGLTITEYDLPAWVEDSGQVLRVTGQMSTTIGTHRFAPGVDVHVQERQTGGVTLIFPSGVPAQTVVLVEGYRHLAPLSATTDTVVLSEGSQSLLVLGAAVRALEDLMDDPYIESRDHSRWDKRMSRLLPKWHAAVAENGRWRESANPRRSRMADVSYLARTY